MPEEQGILPPYLVMAPSPAFVRLLGRLYLMG